MQSLIRRALAPICVIAISSCATGQKKMENRDLEQIYQGAGLERYFLPDLPVWANFSSSADCRRDSLVRFLNFESIRDSYSLDYEALVNFQHMINRRFDAVKTDREEQLYLKDEAFIFYNIYEQVSGGGRDFLAPKFDRISLIWLDPMASSLDKVDKLLESEEVAKGHPVLVSSCMSSKSMEKLSESRGWDRFGVKFISQEMFTPYNSNFQLGHDYILNFPLLLPNKELRLFAPEMPPHFKGINRLIKI